MLYDVIVIGAGASGMMAAITASEQNKRVLLLEANDRAGRKLLATGNGRCNFTHKNITAADYYTDDKKKLKLLLEQYSDEEIVSLFEKKGMLSRNINDYIYPFSETAVTVLDIIRIQLQELGCELLTEHEVKCIQKSKSYFDVSGDGFRFEGKTVILAAGSKAGGFYKGKQDMYHLAKSVGHSCTGLFPALAKCHCRETFYKMLAGVRAKAKLNLYIDDELTKSEYGEVQFTKSGISGIPVFQLSGDIGQALAIKKKVTVSMNFLPDFKNDDLTVIVRNRMKIMKSSTVEQFYTGLLHKKLMSLFIKMAHLKEQEQASSYSEKQLVKVLHYALSFLTEIDSVEEIENAQVCRGGIPLAECTDTFMSKYQDGLFLCGEILNVDGICGGYNLHFAWASGRMCGLSAANYTNHI